MQQKSDVWRIDVELSTSFAKTDRLGIPLYVNQRRSSDLQHASSTVSEGGHARLALS